MLIFLIFFRKNIKILATQQSLIYIMSTHQQEANSQQQGSGASCPPINQETNTVLPPRITGYVAYNFLKLVYKHQMCYCRSQQLQLWIQRLKERNTKPTSQQLQLWIQTNGKKHQTKHVQVTTSKKADWTSEVNI
jgi:hypothetical protein